MKSAPQPIYNFSSAMKQHKQPYSKENASEKPQGKQCLHGKQHRRQ